jgi:hypothetical protein
MKIRQLAATAAFAAAATTVTYCTAAADPAATSTLPTSTHGIDHGVSYNLSREGTTLVADITGGRFRIDTDEVVVTASDGTVVTTVPLAFPIASHGIALDPHLDKSGTKLVAKASDIGHWELTSPRSRSIGGGAAVGMIVGALAGGFIGLIAGIATEGLLLPITLPVGLIGGLLVGGLIGGAAGAAIPNSDVPDKWEYQKDCDYYGDYHFCY